uniref:CBM20 domain-containing protein n=1 Tax=candidate division WOR-3 bacterium TaxID=2052148 RepID=A0A7V3KMJ3_UNCW3
MRLVKFLITTLSIGLLFAGVEYKDGKVIFTLREPQAKDVVVTGTFSNWNPTGIKMTKKDNTWVAEVDLKPGTYEYKFIIDGVWKEDPDNPWKVPDGFGGSNSKFTLTDKGEILFSETPQLGVSALKSLEYIN